MRKHQYLVCCNNIIKASAPAFSHLKSTRERNVRQKRSFSILYAHFKRQSGAQGRPKGAQSVTFGGHIGESGPLRKHQYLFCFNNIIKASAPAFSHLKSTRERNVRQRRSFSILYAHFKRQSGAQGRPKGVQRAQKEPQKPPPGHLKIIKKLTWGHTRAKREPGRLQGCPREGK